MKHIRQVALLFAGVMFGAISCSPSSALTGLQTLTVSILMHTTALTIGQTEPVAAVIRDATGNAVSGRVVTWSSSKPAVASVSTAGLVTALSAGTSNITGTSDGASGSTDVTVVPLPSAPVATVNVRLNADALTVGQSTQASATMLDVHNSVLTGRVVDWRSSNTAVATVSATGLVSAVKAGSATITGTSEGVSGTASITINAAPPAAVASVGVALENSAMVVGQTTQATATTHDADDAILTGRSISWKSSSPAVATVSGAGLVTAIAAGTANITATSEGKSGSAPVTITVAPPAPVASVTVTLSASALIVGAKSQASATTKDANNVALVGRSVSWRSSNTGVARISTTGLVTAVSAGSAVITATSEGKSGSATATVSAPAPAPVASVSVAVNSGNLTVGGTTSASATLRDAGNTILTGRSVTWKSSNSTVASVSGSGLVTAVAAGSASITATSEGRSGSAAVTVTAASPPPPPPSGAAKAIFSDGFEGGTLSYAQNGVRWSGTSWVDVSTSIAHSGSHAARFRQGESTNWGELRFDGLPNLSEAYIQFWIYFPSGTESPSVGSKVQVLGGKNDKFFRLWGNKDADYGALPGDKVGASTWGDGSGQDGKLGVEYQYTPPTGAQWGMGEGDVPQGRVSFINDANRGRWVRIRIHAKVASAANNDGVVQIWTDDKLILSRTTLHSYPGAGAPNTFTTGYLLGAANNGFVPGQYTYIDDVVFSSGGFTTP